MDLAALYSASKDRIAELTAGLSEERLALRPSASPAWTVKDVVSHVTGIAADVVAGNLSGVGSDEWTAAQVDSRREKSIAEVLREWEGTWSTLGPMAKSAPPTLAMSLLGDVISHEHDIREALQEPGARDGEAIDATVDNYASRVAARIGKAELPGLRLLSGDREIVAGEREIGATVAASPFELLRAMTGRRSPEQVSALKWDGDAAPYVAIFSNYGWPSGPINE